MLIGICQPTAVCKMCVVHSETGCTKIHLIYKFFFCAGNKFCHGYACIISGCNNDTFDQCFYSLYFTFLEKDLRSAHGFCVGTCCNRIIQRNVFIMKLIKNKDQCHDFCDTRRASAGVFIFCEDDLSCICFH